MTLQLAQSTLQSSIPSQWLKAVRYFGIDFMEFVHPRETMKFPGLAEIDEDNSSFAYIETEIGGQTVYFSYSLIKPVGFSKGYKFTTNFMDRAVDCFAILHGGKSGSTTSRDKLVLYSGFFVLLGNGAFRFSAVEFLQKYFNILPGSMTRMDIALDVDMPLPKIVKRFDKGLKFHSELGDDEKYLGFFQTYYTSQIQNSKNRTRQVRIYDKVLDSFKKQKTFLFPHLQGCKEMRRIELELREMYCSRMQEHPFMILSDPDCLPGIFQSNISKFSTFFSDCLVPLKKYAKPGSDLRQSFIDAGQIPESYQSRVNGYLRNVIESTGYIGLWQIILDVKFDIELSKKDGTIRHTPERQAFDMLVELVNYLYENLGIPGWKLWIVFDRFKSIRKHHPISGISEVKRVFHD